MDASQWPQGIGGVVRTVDENSRAVEKKPRPQQGINCPRCNSTNTKFCYYNNYSLSQPRYFCKSCRRYWTEGGTLRSVPVGGGSRKKHRSSSSSSYAKKLELTDLSPPPQNPRIHDGQDLNLAYNPPIYNGISELVALPFALDHHTQNPNISSTSSSCHLPFMELLKTAGNLDPISANPASDSNSMLFPSTFPMHEYKPSLSFSLDGLENGYGNMQSNVQSHTTSSRIGFQFEESKPEFDQNRVDSNGYWNGMLSGGSW